MTLTNPLDLPLPVNAYWPIPLGTVRIALVGEAPGEQEEKKGEPFVGAAGYELSSMLATAGINRSDCLITNVFRYRPPGNKVDMFCVPKAEAGDGYTLPPLRSGKYVHPQLVGELERLRGELVRAKLTLVIALGNTALWALTGRTGIGGLRGTVCESTLVPGLKVLPTYHPAAVLRDYSLRVTTIADLLKAKGEAEFPEIRRPDRTLWIADCLDDLEKFETWINPTGVFPDIETDPKRRLLKCISIAVRSDFALVIPLVDTRKPDWNYWTEHEEIQVWRWLGRVLRHWRNTGQNYSYDWQWLFNHGVVPNYRQDLMLLQHALYPELPKSLAFLGSIYTNEPAWKLDRPRGGKTEKRED